MNDTAAPGNRTRCARLSAVEIDGSLVPRTSRQSVLRAAFTVLEAPFLLRSDRLTRLTVERAPTGGNIPARIITPASSWSFGQSHCRWRRDRWNYLRRASRGIRWPRAARWQNA